MDDSALVTSATASSPFAATCNPLPSREELERFLESYDLGTLMDFHPGRRGRRGRVQTDKGQFWLVGPGMTDGFLESLLDYLAGQALPVPTVVRGRDGQWIRPLGDYPGALVSWPEGRHLAEPSEQVCARVGDLLGRIHVAGLGFGLTREPHRDQRWRRETAEALAHTLTPEEQALLQDEVRLQGLYRHADLPRGIIHGAPNRRRLVFGPGDTVGLTGFGHACHHVLLLDVAVAVNDCCNGPGGRLNRDLSAALLGAYHRLRPLSPIERGAWPVLLRQAALDGWLEALMLGQDGGPARARLELRIGEDTGLQRYWIG